MAAAAMELPGSEEEFDLSMDVEGEQRAALVTDGGKIRRERRTRTLLPPVRARHLVPGLAAIGCLVALAQLVTWVGTPQVRTRATPPAASSVGLYSTVNTESSGIETSGTESGAVSPAMEWQCDGGPGFGKELASREMDPNSATGYVRCCKCFGPGKLGSTPEPCLTSPVSWHKADEICKKHDLRLCTKRELELGEAASTGCDYDDRFVWATHQPYGFTTLGTGSVCRLNENDHTMDGNRSAVVLIIYPKSECEKKCLQEDACTGYEYRSTERRCEIWTKTITFHTQAKHPYEFECKVKACPYPPKAA
eukprot:CAMPEP_0179099932 /NCGR_PEP_ID=MMETSP0796-20121207/46123_1 /TAXON_ID=73915 /ORGANISM="Pyrodinium bahamense, Strain pbaha01" /LENGTH=307 /DNA_ID=CAMNT_0020797735 /DNA_START=117 /DNA_END=1040 /DNA_ORIENTATION=-